jgi:hypothetical protein
LSRIAQANATFSIVHLRQLAPAIVAASLSGCSGGSTSAAPATSVSTPLPVLVPGSRFTYAGRLSESITFASASSQNSSGVYTTSDVVTISKAPTAAPAPIELHQDVRYAVIEAPASGVQLRRRLIDSFESSAATSATQTISQAKEITTTIGIDQTANRIEGDGPYRYRSTLTTAYSEPRVLLIFPLVSGTTHVPLARTVTTAARSANVAGKVYLARSTTTHYSNAGAYVETGSIGAGEAIDAQALASGAGLLVHTGVSALREKIGLPIPGPSQTYQIPVALTIGSSKNKFLAGDWYPGAAAPPSPLATTLQTVRGFSRIPSTCGVKVAVSDVQEVDTSSTSLDVVSGTYSTMRTRDFLSNGNTACRVTASTVFTYSVTSGRLLTTTVDSSFEGLTAASIP